jgi:hypothetical protein
MKYYENIEKLFFEDVREKKKTGRGAFHMRGKGVKHGFNGALRTPYHFMKTKEKKKLDGEVVSYNMYETILHKDEFFLKDEATQKMLLTRWREIYDNDVIVNAMGIYKSVYFKLAKDLDVPKKPRGGVQPRTGKTKKKKAPKFVAINESTITDLPQTQLTMEVEDKPKLEQKLITTGLHLEYNGDYDAEQISKIFTKLQLLVEGETNKFNLAISVTERA